MAWLGSAQRWMQVSVGAGLAGLPLPLMVNDVLAPVGPDPFSRVLVAVTVLPDWLTLALLHEVTLSSPVLNDQVTVQPIPIAVPVLVTVMVARSELLEVET